jgi:hypothetical protein
MSMTAARWHAVDAHSLPADALDVQVVSLSRNFGKEAALMAGLDHVTKGAVLFMDGDGQHPPALVEQLVRHWIVEGYDVVYTAKAHRDNESFLRRSGGRGFYALINWGARQKIPEDAGDFRLLSPRAARHFASCRSATASSRDWRPGSASARSASTTNPRRATHGVTSFSAARLIGLSIEGPDLVLGGAAALRQPARRAARLRRVPVRPVDPVGGLGHRQVRCRAIHRWWSA